MVDFLFVPISRPQWRHQRYPEELQLHQHERQVLRSLECVLRFRRAPTFVDGRRIRLALCPPVRRRALRSFHHESPPQAAI